MLGITAVKVDVGSKIDTTGTLTDEPVAMPKFEPKMQRMLENNVQNAMEQMRRKMVKDVKWEQESALLKVGFE